MFAAWFDLMDFLDIESYAGTNRTRITSYIEVP